MISDNIIYVGIVDEYYNYDEGSVIFHIPNVVDRGRAYSMFSENKPAIGDEIILFKLQSQLNSFWFYMRILQTGQLIIEYNGANIILKDGKIYIQAKEIHINNEVNDRETRDGNEAMLYGTTFKEKLDALLDYFINGYKVITPMGPSSATSPDSVARLMRFKEEFNEALSDYIKTYNPNRT